MGKFERRPALTANWMAYELFIGNAVQRSTYPAAKYYGIVGQFISPNKEEYSVNPIKYSIDGQKNKTAYFRSKSEAVP